MFWKKIDEVKTIKQSNPYGTGTAEHVFKYFAKDQRLVDEVMAWCQRAAETREADRDVLSREALAKSMNELTASITALAKTVPEVFKSDVIPTTAEYKKVITAEGTKVFQKGDYGEWILIDSEKRE